MQPLPPWFSHIQAVFANSMNLTSSASSTAQSSQPEGPLAQPVFYGSASMVGGPEVGSMHSAMSDFKPDPNASRDPADVGCLTPDVFHAMFRGSAFGWSIEGSIWDMGWTIEGIHIQPAPLGSAGRLWQLACAAACEPNSMTRLRFHNEAEAQMYRVRIFPLGRRA